MKKKFLSLMVAVAMLFSIVTFVVQADTDGEGDYFYFDIEHFAEDTTKEIYMTPIKIYTNGFYDYSGEFKTFKSEFKSAADAIGYVLDYMVGYLMMFIIALLKFLFFVMSLMICILIY